MGHGSNAIRRGIFPGRWEKEKISKIRNRSKTRLKIRKIPIFHSSAFIFYDIDSKISHLTFPYRWPQFVCQHLCSISYSFAARWPKPICTSVFYQKFVSQQPEVVESRVIAHFDGFLVANTIQ